MLSVSQTSDNTVTGSMTGFASKELTFHVDYKTGTNMSFVWNFGDAHSEQTSESSIKYTYTNAGVYDMTVNASNPMETGVIQSMHLLMLVALDIESFTYNKTVTINSSAPFVIKMNEQREDICFEFKISDDTATKMLWKGTSQSICETARQFKVSNFKEIPPPTGSVEMLYAFQLAADYEVQVTVLTFTDDNIVTKRMVTVTEQVKLCSNPNVTAKDNRDSAYNPITIRRSEGLALSTNNFKITNLKEGTSLLTQWEMFEHDNTTGEYLPKTFNEYGVEQSTNTIGISRHTLPYGLYKFTMKVTLKDYQECSGSSDVFVKIVGTPLDVNIKYGAFRLIGSHVSVEMNAADVSSDPDSKDGDSTGMTFEWFCRKKTETDSTAIVEIPGLYDYFTHILCFTSIQLSMCSEASAKLRKLGKQLRYYIWIIISFHDTVSFALL